VSSEPDPEDPALLEAFRAGDETAFHTLLQRYEGVLAARIRRNLPRRIQRRVSIADVLQETELAAHQGRGQLAAADMKGLAGWLLGIAERQALMHARHHGRVAKRAVQREVSRDGRPETHAVPGRQPSPSELVTATETLALARRAREALPPDYQEVLRMGLEDRVPLREVAERMDRSYEATRKLYGRAFLRFKQIFDEMREASA